MFQKLVPNLQPCMQSQLKPGAAGAREMAQEFLLLCRELRFNSQNQYTGSQPPVTLVPGGPIPSPGL